MFKLHLQLEKDTFYLGDISLCRVLLMNNRHFPWVVLVPKIADARELTDLKSLERSLLMDEIATTMQQMQMFLKPDKMNVAALGNQVPQLHVHVIARYTTDAAWPNPVWGTASDPYKPEKLERVIMDYKRALYLLS